MMKPDTDQPTAAESTPRPPPDGKNDAKDDFTSLPMPELQAKLRSSPDGHRIDGRTFKP